MPGVDPKLDLIRSVPLFTGFGRREIERLGQLADEIDVADGTVLMREGATGHELFILVDGSVRVERGGRLIAERGPGSILGEIALVDGGPRTATVTAGGPARLLVIGHREFNTLMDEFPDVRLKVLTTLAMRVRSIEVDAAH